ncbi:hypothetical protein AAG607_00025 [Citromicrobium bathyomarinum]|uniref:hypothetical protein n=1 Tax=Sphingomonadales TaxID=204457 RepID=UPI000C506786|nr:hypothetical protein [Citromicrobium sp.]|tara:strand:+ start:35336 stop:35722 length:387 start_codon:yes stop_codon:yes gene_type:complete
MTAEQRRLKRTRLIERVRTVEQRQSALAAAEAETQRVRLDAVSAKTRALAAHYAASRDATDAQSLRRSGTMSSHLRDLSALAERHAQDARDQSEASMAALARNERRRRRAEEDYREAASVLREKLAAR